MERLRPEAINSFEFANESISWIKGYENEAAVDDASRQIVRYFGLEAFVFGALFRNGGGLVGGFCVGHVSHPFSARLSRITIHHSEPTERQEELCPGPQNSPGGWPPPGGYRTMIVDNV